MKREKFTNRQDQVAFHLGQHEKECWAPYQGLVILELKDQNGNVIQRIEKPNVVTLDAGIHAARLFKDKSEPNFGALMLAVGTGASGSAVSPDAPNSKQRKLNNEVERKAFSSVTFRNASGVAVAYPTNIIDLTCQFTASEAVGALNEMGILSPISSNTATKNHNPNAYPTYDPTVDVTNYDVLLNYLTFGLVSKSASSILTITWRFTF